MMRLGPFNIDIGLKKSYRDLERFMAIEKRASTNDPKTNPQVQLSEYKSWVASSVGLIGKSVAKVPFKYYKSETNEEITSTYHGLNRLKKILDNPNPFMSMRFIKGWMQAQWDLCGMAAAYKARNTFGEITEIWPLNMNQFLRVTDKDGRPLETCTTIIPEDVRYIFMIGGRQYNFGINELLLLMHPHPKYQYIGASPIQSQAYVVDIQTYIEIYERDFFANSARVDMVLSTDDDLGTTKAEDIKQRWIEKFRGNFHDIAVLDKGLKPVPMKYTNQDFQFLELSRWSRDMVLAVYPINPAKLGITDKVNRSSSVFVDIEYNTYTIQPRLTMWDEELTQIAKEFDLRIEIKHENPIPRDRQIEVQEARTFLGGASCYSIDEFRKTQNLKSAKDGDVILVPTKLIPLDMLRDYWKAQIKLAKNPPISGTPDAQTDPNRHSDDPSHLNPDGSDNRDTLPTDSRSFEIQIEKYYRKVWNDKLIDYYKNIEIVNNIFICNLMSATIKTYLSIFNKIDLYKENKWIEETSFKICDLLSKTIDIKENIEDQFNSNPRVAKICNFTIKSVINYARFLIIDNSGLKKIWKVNDNICGHKGRIKEFETKGKFKVGDTELDFPGQIINLNCNCGIDIENTLLI
jgi:HK97 family phage portal protein